MRKKRGVYPKDYFQKDKPTLLFQKEEKREFYVLHRDALLTVTLLEMMIFCVATA